MLQLSRQQWAVLFAAWLGWGFDIFDGLLFNYVAPNAVPTLLGLEIGSAAAKAATLYWTGLLTSVLLVGWAIGESMSTELVLSALDMAIAQRRPREGIHHSDQGSQYTSIAFGTRCAQMGVRPSMGSVGDAYDNAMAESFFASLECELIDRRTWRSKTEARMALFTGEILSHPLAPLFRARSTRLGSIKRSQKL